MIGQFIGPYQVLSKLGEGGMGEVWKARDARLNRLVAVKRLTEPHSGRFEQEARAIAALNHPHIRQIYDVGADYLWSSDGRDLLPSASASEIRDAYGGYYAYFGTWEIDEGARTVTHHIRGSMRAVEVGADYVRPFELSGDQLLLRSTVGPASVKANPGDHLATCRAFLEATIEYGQAPGDLCR